MDLVKLLLSLSLELFILLFLVSQRLLLKLVIRALPVLRGHAYLLIEFHYMGHLILQSKKLLFKIFDLHLEILHRGLPVLHYALHLFNL